MFVLPWCGYVVCCCMYSHMPFFSEQQWQGEAFLLVRCARTRVTGQVVVHHYRFMWQHTARSILLIYTVVVGECRYFAFEFSWFCWCLCAVEHFRGRYSRHSSSINQAYYTRRNVLPQTNTHTHTHTGFGTYILHGTCLRLSLYCYAGVVCVACG